MKLKKVIKVANLKKDFKGADKQLQLTTNKFIDNTNRLIYNFNK